MKTTKLLLVAFCAASLLSPLSAQTPESSPAATPLASIPPDSPKYGVYPVGYRDIITRWLAERLTDPASAKVEFGEPVASEVTQKNVKASGYRVEFRVNSRNRFGTYTGFQKHQVLIRNGEIIWADRVKG